jgi:hypothetical protein
MQPHFGGKSIVLLHDGARLMVSRRRKDSIERILRGK